MPGPASLPAASWGCLSVSVLSAVPNNEQITPQPEPGDPAKQNHLLEQPLPAETGLGWAWMTCFEKEQIDVVWERVVEGGKPTK